jgi:hypothetical protein
MSVDLARGKTYVVAVEVVDGDLGEHGVVLKLGLAQRRAVTGNEDQLGLARAEGLHGGLGTHGNWRFMLIFTMHTILGLGCKNSPLPDFMTRARREARVSPDFLVLAIMMDFGGFFGVLGGWR